MSSVGGTRQSPTAISSQPMTDPMLGVGAAEPVGSGVAAPSSRKAPTNPLAKAMIHHRPKMTANSLPDEAERAPSPGWRRPVRGRRRRHDGRLPWIGAAGLRAVRRGRRRSLPPGRRHRRAGDAATGRRSRAGRGSRRGRRPRRPGGPAPRRAAPRSWPCRCGGAPTPGGRASRCPSGGPRGCRGRTPWRTPCGRGPAEYPPHRVTRRETIVPNPRPGRPTPSRRPRRRGRRRPSPAAGRLGRSAGSGTTMAGEAVPGPKPSRWWRAADGCSP